MKLSHTGHAAPRSPGATCDDAFAVRQRRGTLVAALADGLGSSSEGGAAARRAVEMLCDYCLGRPRAWSARRALADFTAQANRHLHAEALERFGTPELACTLAAVLLEGGRAYGCNVGDSAIFLRRNGRLQKVSDVHALAQPGFNHVLTRALGLEADVEPHYFEMDLAAGDVLVLCSDGITATLPHGELDALLARRASAASIVAAAQAAATANPELADDTSVVLLEVQESSGTPESAGQSLEVPRALRAGDTVAGHVLVRPLAKGNERVWLARDASESRAVLKFPPAEASSSEALRDAFVREAWNATRLASPDLVRAWQPEGAAFSCYAMEFVDAPTVRALLRFGRLGVEEALALAQFFLRVGQFLVGHDLAHGDLKPDNVLALRSPGATTFRLLDLGCVAELFSVTSRAGTPSYLAPERFRGGPLSERTEIFAIGVTLYEALAGSYPYGEVERFQNPRFDAPPRRLTRLNPAVPSWFEAIILRAIEPDPERRYQHFSEMAFDLANPAKVQPHYLKGAPLLERNPLRFYKVLCFILLIAVLVLAAQLGHR